VLRKSGIDDGIAECAMQEKAIANAQVERLDRARYRLERHWIFLITLNLGLARICSAVSGFADAGERFATPVCEFCDQVVNTFRWIHWIFMPRILVPFSWPISSK
jgi:hypothetical protein